MGSSVSVEMLQFGLFEEIVARMGDNFFGPAQRKLAAGLVSQVVLLFPPYICFYLLVFTKVGSSISIGVLHRLLLP